MAGEGIDITTLDGSVVESGFPPSEFLENEGVACVGLALSDLLEAFTRVASWGFSTILFNTWLRGGVPFPVLEVRSTS